MVTTNQPDQLTPEEQPIAGHSRNVANPQKRHWLKRLLWAIALPIALFILSIVLLNIFGTQTIEKLNSALQSFWLPATIFRITIYLLIAFVIVPKMLSQGQAKNDSTIQTIKDDIAQNQINSDDDFLYQLLKKAEAQQRIYNYLLNRRYLILIGLIVFDMITLQLPYFLKY